MKKIAIITRSMWAGGAERVIAQLFKYFCKSGIECALVMLDDDEIKYELPWQVKISAIGKKSNSLYIDKYKRYREIRKIVKQMKPDVVLSMPEDVGIYVILAMLGTHVPVVISERNNPWVMPWNKLTRILRKIAYPFAAGYIFQTKKQAAFFSTRIQRKGIVLPNPLDLDRIPDQWQQEKRKEIIGAGRFDKQKNFPLLIKAFAEFYKTHPDYTLIIFGDGSKRLELEALAASLLPENSYSLPGRSNELLKKINGGSMFVLSSDYEGMPNIIIEAMAMGMPVISTDCPVGGPAELIKNGVNGLLISVGDESSMVEAMYKIADSDTFATALGNKALRIKKRLDANIVVKQWEQYLDECYKHHS